MTKANSFNRDISVDIIKFIAIFLIINSHMDSMYPSQFRIFATGGAIGDVLFLFSSGYTLFLGRMDRFDHWYKRRINRIYPTVFAFSLVTSTLFDSNLNFYEVLLYGGGEFVSFIMLYYVFLYVIRRWFINNIKFIYLIVILLVSFVYIYWFPYKYEISSKGMYGVTTYFRWLPYFGFMLFGAYLGMKTRKLKFNTKFDFIKLFLCLFIFYGVQFASKLYVEIAPFQIFTLIPLLGIVYYIYKICNSQFFSKLYKNKYGNAIIMFTSGVCLEAYLIQGALFTDSMNYLFPINLFIMFLYILIVSYFLRCMARFFSQTFVSEPYQWSEIVKIY